MSFRRFLSALVTATGLFAALPAAAGTGACGTAAIAPTASSYSPVQADDGKLLSSLNATGPAVGWASTSIAVNLPSLGSITSPWTFCGTTDANNAVAINSPLLAAPGTPSLSFTNGGSLGAVTYYVKTTYTNATGETLPSSESSLAVAANKLLVVATPGAIDHATGYNVYVATSTGAETKQNASPISLSSNWTEPSGGLISGSAVPSTGTAASAYILDGGQALNQYVVGTGNYQTATFESDGSNYRVISTSLESRRINGATATLPTRWVYPGGPGYLASQGDSGNAIASPLTSGGLAVTLPNVSTIAAGWTTEFFASGSQPLTVTPNATNGGGIFLSDGSEITTGSSYSLPQLFPFILQFDGNNFIELVGPNRGSVAVVSNNTVFRALAPNAYPAVRRVGYATSGDSAEFDYIWNGTSTCTDDGGSCIKPTGLATGRWILVPTALIDVRGFGAVADNGTTNNTTPLQNLATYLATLPGTGGSVAWVPSTGKFFSITTGITANSGVAFLGPGTKGYPGQNQTCATWAGTGGAWIQSTDATNPAFTLAGHGTKFEGINFCQTQPTPSGTPGVAWTPTVWPDSIQLTGEQVTIRDIMCVACSNIIDFSYTTGSGGGTGNVVANILGDDYGGSCLQTHKVNDDINVSNVQCRGMWNPSNPNVVVYQETIGNSQCWLAGYTDNPRVDGFECFQNAYGALFKNELVLGVTHSLYNGQIGKFECNLVRVCMAINNSITVVNFRYDAILAQQDLSTYSSSRSAPSDTMFQFGSDVSDVRGNTIYVPDIGGGLVTLGAGAAGNFAVKHLTVLRYADISTQPLFSLAAGAEVYKDVWDITKLCGAGCSSSSGYVFSGAGAGDEGVVGPRLSWIPWFSGSQISAQTCNGSGQIISTNADIDPGEIGATQIRITGSLTVGTPVTGNGQIWMFNFSSTPTALFSFGSSGLKTFDSNWIDLPYNGGTGIFNYNQLGQIVLQCPNTATWSSGDFVVKVR